MAGFTSWLMTSRSGFRLSADQAADQSDRRHESRQVHRDELTGSTSGAISQVWLVTSLHLKRSWAAGEEVSGFSSGRQSCRDGHLEVFHYSKPRW